MLSITPSYLRAWRESLGVNRETVAAFCPPFVKGSTIRDKERPATHSWSQWHVDALQEIEDWFNHYADATEDGIWFKALEYPIDGKPVLWIYGQECFHLSGFSDICFGYADLYNVCRLNVRSRFVEQGKEVIDAEFIPKDYDSFRERINTTADHPELRAKWWRHYRMFYKQHEEVK